jgi:putative serine protease PepD
VNAAGQVVGVNTAIATMGTSSRSGNIGIGFAIPVDRMTTIVKGLID